MYVVLSLLATSLLKYPVQNPCSFVTLLTGMFSPFLLRSEYSVMTDPSLIIIASPLSSINLFWISVSKVSNLSRISAVEGYSTVTYSVFLYLFMDKSYPLSTISCFGTKKLCSVRITIIKPCNNIRNVILPDIQNAYRPDCSRLPSCHRTRHPLHQLTADRLTRLRGTKENAIGNNTSAATAHFQHLSE